jgi:type IV pilus assembly protein PilB
VTYVPDIVELLLEDGILHNASDIHIDPAQMESVTVRCRVDGIVFCIGLYKKDIHSEVLGRIKILSKLRTDVHDCAQDNSFVHKSLTGRVFDVRVSIAPTIFGENIVLRLIDRSRSNIEERLEDLLFSEVDYARVKNALSLGHGMIVIAGPTGSGKTSTLYTMLAELARLSSERMIVTIEDPVERMLEGTRQIPVQQDKGFTFAKALRGILRQDPDVLMVGEMRDTETAKAAIQCALSGHLLLTTIHAKDAASIVPRLIDMGIDPYMLASTLTILISQRLVRRCYSGDPTDIYSPMTYQGRCAVFEVIDVSEDFQKAILSKSSREVLWSIASKEGSLSLLENGLQKVREGFTTTEEVYRMISQ